MSALLDTVVNEEAAKAAEILKRGGVAIIPTDTVYGIAAHCERPEAIERIYAIKQRPKDKPLQLLISGIEAAEKLGAFTSDRERRIALCFWPGPLTLILRTSRATEGFRVPDSRIALRVIESAGGAIRATSANLSGRPPAVSADEAAAELGDKVDFVLDGGKIENGPASTVARLEMDESITILREGAISRSDLERVK